jgi:hypothetical protein
MIYEGKRQSPPSFAIIVLLIAAFLGACVLLGVIAYLNRSGPSSRPPAPRTIVRLSGDGTMNTESFHLGGAYGVTWFATDKSGVGCEHRAILRSTDNIASLAESLGYGLVSKNDSKWYYGDLYLASTDYYVAVSSTCSWTFTFTPH